MDFTEEVRFKLASVGLSTEQIDRVAAGKEVAFDFPGDTPVGIALIQVKPGLLRCGILEINFPGGGLAVLLAFRTHAFEVANVLGVKRVELFGMAVINRQLRDLFLRQSFVPRMVPCPEDLGGGAEEVEIVAREFLLP